MLEDITDAVRRTALELFDKAGLKAGQTVVVGCSTSEISGHDIGTHSNTETGVAVFNALLSVFSERKVFIAAQCCEHLNRSVIIEREAAGVYEIVNAVPTPDAGGSFASAAYKALIDPVALEYIRADAGIDIGGTLIGMHLKRVVVPLRLSISHIGKAPLMAARTRPPFVGGARARYDDTLF